MPRGPSIGGWVLAAVSLHAAAQEATVTRKHAIAHRGASAYAPEHTLAAYRLASAQGADYVEQDLAVTRDGVLICLHDDSLERTTNVAEVFPDRASTDRTGRRRWLAVDFTLEEIKRLDAGTWFDERFAGERVPTWEEAVEAVGDAAGLYPELKSPDLYRQRGIDVGRLFAESLRRLPERAPRPLLNQRPLRLALSQQPGRGLDRPPAGHVIVQSFEDRVLRELAAALPDVPRTFLVDPRDGGRWLSSDGLREIATFATGIGPNKRLLDGRPEIVRAAHALGLTVAPYTFTSTTRTRFSDVREEMRYYLYGLGVDALFTDNPDLFPRETATAR